MATSKSNCGARLAMRYSPTFASSAIDAMMTETKASLLSAGVVAGRGGPQIGCMTVSAEGSGLAYGFRKSV